MKVDIETKISGGIDTFINGAEEINKAVQEEVCKDLAKREKGKYKSGEVSIPDGKRRIFGSIQAPPDKILLTELEECTESLYEKLKKEYGGLTSD